MGVGGGGIDYVATPNSVSVGGSITSVCVCFRYYHGVVQDTSTEEYYVVSFEDGTYCDNLPPTDIVVSYLIHLNHFKGDSSGIRVAERFL